MRKKIILGILALVLGTAAGQAQTAWQQKLKEDLPLMGHRNWIVIVDSAYPLQSSTGMETIYTGEDHLTVVDSVLKAIQESKHVRPLAHTDAELQSLRESETPGVDHYRDHLQQSLAGIPVDSVPHESLINQLDKTSKSFHVLVLKTTMTIPYTSVFLQLDCKYWSADSEARLRERMKASGKGTK